MGASVFRRVQEGHHGEPAITRERKHFSKALYRKHFSKIHESDCKPSTCLACSYLNWREEVSAALCSAVNRMNERMNERQNDYRNPSCRGLMNAINVVQAITANFVEDGTEIACTKIYKKVAFERSCII